ncbi:MAG: hypothetical protein C4318_01240 [Acidimicrobiia bacterium]
MSDQWLICRKYEPNDRAAVRFICCETGHLGDPIDPYFSDREVFADFVTRYYTDVDSAWSWVLEDRGEVVGYLTGCPDSKVYAAKVKKVWALVATKALARGVPLRPSSGRLTWRLLWDVARERPSFGHYGPEYPAHLHINLLPQARGRGGGRMLIDAYLAALRAASIRGVFLETSCENTRAVAFFRSMGFAPLHAAPSPGGRLADGGRIHVLAMGMRLR